MDIYTLSGKVHKVFDLNQYSEKFRKREFVVEVNSVTDRGSFIDYIKLQAVNQVCDDIEDLKKGDMVVVRWGLAGRKYKKDSEEKYFTNVEAVEIDIVSREDGTGTGDTIEDQLPFEEPENTLFDVPAGETPDDEPDDLPF